MRYSISTARPITHLLLIDRESAEETCRLARNTLVIRDSLAEVFSDYYIDPSEVDSLPFIEWVYMKTIYPIRIRLNQRDRSRDESPKLLSGKYLVRLVVPTSRSDLADVCDKLELELRENGVEFAVCRVAPEDSTLFSGKAGLMSCAIWATAGCVLLNDSPISVKTAMALPALANKLKNSRYRLALGKQRLIRRGFRFALLRDTQAIGPQLMVASRRLPDGYTLADFIRFIKGNVDPAEVTFA